MSAPAPEVAEVLPPGSGSIGFLATVAVVYSVYALAEHLIVPLEARDILGRLNQESKQIQKGGGVLGLWIQRVEIRALDLDGIVAAPVPLAVEVQTLPAVADGGPDLAPSGLGSQHVNHHSSAVAAGLVAVQFHEPVFPLGKALSLRHRNTPGFSRSHLGKSLHKRNHGHGSSPSSGGWFGKILADFA